MEPHKAKGMKSMAYQSLLIGICGGTGSGKTTVAETIASALPGRCRIVPQDAYYKANTHLSFEERCKQNYDHPDAFDTNLLKQHLAALKAGKPVHRPIYDFKIHARSEQTVLLEPADVILLEGILIFEDKEIRDLLDLKIFVDTDADVRIIRRILRDVKERGRTLDSVVDQYLGSVKPMHEAFVEPSKRYADIILPEGGYNNAGLDVIISKIRMALSEISRVENCS